MIPNDFLREVRRIVGPPHVSVGRTNAELYSYDGSLAFGTPDAIVFPGDSRETADVIRAASKAGVSCTPRGFGTNLSGGSVSPRGGVVICFSRMNRILAIEPERHCAIVQPGVTNLELQDALASLGFFYAPDPASQKVSTLGGNVGENSGGPHCLKYGVTTNHILGLEVVLPDGATVRLGGPALDPPGFDLRGLVVGSEGTLGAVTEITVRIMPQPESVKTLLAIYDNVFDAAHSVSGIIAKGIVPATLEMMDAPVMHAVEDSFPCGYPRDAAAVLIIEVEGPAAGLATETEDILEICRANGCRSVREAKDAAERDQLWAGRRGAFGAIARIAPNYLVNDCTVPRTRLPEALAQVAAITKKHGIRCGNVFHAGDGNLHPLLLFDARDADQLRQVRQAGWEIMEACVALGGTITGEHGVGTEKIEAMRMVFSEDDLEFQRVLRQAFDPAGLFNLDKIIPADVRLKTPSGPSRQKVRDEGALSPADEEEACDMVQSAFMENLALAPEGGGRRADCGNALDAAAIPLRSARLSALIDYDPANQVVTAGAGMKLAALQEILSAHNQWLPIRPPLAEGCTLGGMAALGACGPERLRYGAPRDLLLGLRFVSGKGARISAGGKVVKNVAGYDVTRLMSGSMGTLGFLTELTFRVLSFSEVCCAVHARGSLETIAAAAGELLRSRMDPTFVCATLEGSGACGDSPHAWDLTIGFEGPAARVRAQTERCAGLLRHAGLTLQGNLEYPACEGLHGKCHNRLFGFPFVARADLPCDLLVRFLSDAAGPLDGASILADFGCGRVTAGLSTLAGDDWMILGRLGEQAQGHVVLEKAPAEFKKHYDVFGPARPEWELMHRVKKALDPHRVFAPGRLPGKL
jgi:glycolate oxidase subunit GlcD